MIWRTRYPETSPSAARARWAVLGCARGHGVAAVIEDAPQQQSPRGGTLYAGAIAVRGELLLHSVEQCWRDDRLVLSRMAGSLVVQLPEIDPVTQEIRERAIGQLHAPNAPARAKR